MVMRPFQEKYKLLDSSRTLTIEIPSGTEELEIIGSVFGITNELPSSY